MGTKIIKIKDICPEGYKLDKERSTLDNLVFIETDYNYISEKLFHEKRGYYCDSCGHIKSVDSVGYGCHNYPSNCTSEKQAKKLLAINQLMNVAKYLNGDWQPDWNSPDVKYKYFIYMEPLNDKLFINSSTHYISSFIYFKTKEFAQKAIDILGEETIKLALSTDW